MPANIYRIEKNDIFGRYIVANRPIKQGELILKNQPIIIGPLIDGCLICFGCHKILRNCGFVYCSKCNKAILCSQKCPGKSHCEDECYQLKENPLTGGDISSNSQIITVLRCLLLRKYNPESWSKIMKLESHTDHRRNTPIWRKHKIGVENILIEKRAIDEEDIKSEIVQKICGVLDVNTFEVRPAQMKEIGAITCPEYQCLRGLYPEAALMAHDCVGNTHLAVDENYVLTIHASVDIPTDQPIYFNYANTLQGTFDRKEHLREGKYFECHCQRCEDPSELETELSSLLCPKCKTPNLRSSQPGSSLANWQCSKCQKSYKSSIIKTALRECKRRIFDTDPSDIKGMEKLLKKLLLTLGPKHYSILEIEQNLVAAYTQWIPNKDNLSRKIELCDHLLPILKVIEPGISRLRAITLYELHSAKINLAHKLYASQDITDEEFISNLLAGESILKESIKMLLYEPSHSPEGVLRQNAMQELKALRNSITQFQQAILMKPVTKIEDNLVKKKRNRNKNKNKK